MISIIDDDRSVREAVKSLVRSLGYEAVAFASAEEYLSADRARDSECIITDVRGQPSAAQNNPSRSHVRSSFA
jgi:FixJ family two-component response regulator